MTSPNSSVPGLGYAKVRPVPGPPEKPKPCCVCKEERAKRDECMLYAKSTHPSKECVTTIQEYKACMKGFGFDV